MYAGASTARKSVKEIVHQFCLQIADQLHSDFSVHGRGSSSAKVDGSEAECFVHGHDKIPGAKNSALIAQGFREQFTQHDADIFDGMVLIDIEVPLGRELQIKS